MDSLTKSAPLPRSWKEGPSRVVVLSCGRLGHEVSNRLASLPEVEVMLCTTPYRVKERSLPDRIRRMWRMEGPPGVLAAVARRALAPPPGLRLHDSEQETDPHLDSRVGHLSFEDFHDTECIEALRRLAPDLGVLAGTYILKESVFEIPRLGTINLHSGKVPEYRGAAPGFWELYHCESEVGVTVHEVVREVDAGRVIRQELFPLDPAPAGDPLEYLDRYRREVLRPNGVRLLVEAVCDILGGCADPRPQDRTRARTFPSPDYRTKQELRRRVARRRKEES